MSTYRTISLSVLLVLFSAASVNAQLSKPAIGGPKKNERTSQTPTLHWENLGNASWYRVWINNKTQGNTHLKKWVKGANSWTIPDSQELNPNDEYRFWVAGWNSSDSLGPWSSPADFRAGEVQWMSVGSPGFGMKTGGPLLQNNLIMEHNGQDAVTIVQTNLHLPDGARILEVTSQWQDNDPGDNAEIFIEQIALFGSQQGHIFEVNTSGSAGTDETTTDSTPSSTQDAIIDNSVMDYQLRVRFPNTGNDQTIRVYKVYIKYVN